MAYCTIKIIQRVCIHQSNKVSKKCYQVHQFSKTMNGKKMAVNFDVVERINSIRPTEELTTH